MYISYLYLHRLKLIYFLVIYITIPWFTGGCAVKLVQHETQPADLNLIPIKNIIEHGDWIVIRGTTNPSNFIASITNMPFSHATIYDAENDEVIESDSSGVHTTPLRNVLAEAQRIWVLKPIWARPDNRPLAVARARKQIGKPYNYTGLIGLGIPNTYYCTELVIDAWRPYMNKSSDNPIPRVIPPGSLHHWGRVVYDSIELGVDN
jgi:cell wall-associated NlpC family hydrolase